MSFKKWAATGVAAVVAGFVVVGLANADEELSFRVEGATAYMSGVIDSDAPDLVEELLEDNPKLKEIVLVEVPGSADDVANLEAALMVREAGLTTRLTKDSMVASGGTDFFLAGKKRIVAKGAQIGVHSWADSDGQTGAEAPKDDPMHQHYLEYYRSIGIQEAFYWYTLEAAPADDVHWMTSSEIKRYQIAN
ncbi:hypothetical protein [Polycladidibacter hongkongensis]|uniref:COG3904 family protein n=1 Tax=Polycladidibacter hongkongensis TaxID=1647556 RepID=UPI000833B3D1|nr:hypothetical protein [Pseudovibrio hongkongensis]